MSYSDFYLKKRNSVSAILPFVAVLVGIFGFSLFMFRAKPTQTQADKKVITYESPVNLGAHEAGIYWRTEKKTKGWILFGETSSNLSAVAHDEQDIGANWLGRMNHYVLLKGLKADTPYYYKIVIDNAVASLKNNDPYVLKTTNELESRTSLSPAYGKVVLPNGTPSVGALILLETPQSYPMLTYSKITGEWLIPLQSIVSRDSVKSIVPDKNQPLTLQVYDEDGNASQVKSNFSMVSPLPQSIVLGTNYSFDNKNDVLSAHTGSISPSTSQIGMRSFEILYPKENARIATHKPLLKGTGTPGERVSVSINPSKSSLNYAKSVVIDKDGNWVANLDVDLPTGDYTMTAQINSASASSVKRTRIFHITKIGEQVLGDSTISTPSATLIPTQIDATDIPTPTSTSLSPTLTVTLTPTIVKTGSNFIPLAGLSFGLVVVGLGVLLAF